MSSPYPVPTQSPPPPKSNAALVILVVVVGVVAALGAVAFVVLPKMTHLRDGSQTAPSAAVPTRAASGGSSTPKAPAAGSSKVGRTSRQGNVGQGSAAYGQSSADAQRAAVDSTQSAAAQQELDRLTHQYNLLEARVTSFDASLNTMRQAQEQQGLNMRGDMASAQNRLHANMERMQSALDQKDLDSAKRYLELCDRDAAKLADFLGQ